MITMRSIITILDYLILDNINKASKTYITQVSKDIGYTRASISVNIQKFADLHIVDFDYNKQDRTKKWYYLTEKGHTFLNMIKEFESVKNYEREELDGR